MPWTPVVVAVIAMIIALLLKRKGHDTGGLSIKKAAKWFVIAASLALVFWYGPYFTLGYGWGFVTTGHGGWSMASDDGIMPGSLTLHKAYASYEVGDDISFDYRGSNDPAENGRSVKRILAVNSDGTYRVGGTNELNSIMPVDIAPKEIYGKIVWHRSFLPESYWRWMSRGWSLKIEEVTDRFWMVFSIRTVCRLCSAEGRYWNSVQWSIGPLHDAFRAGGVTVMTRRFGRGWYAFSGHEVVASGSGSVALLEDPIAVGIDGDEITVMRLCFGKVQVLTRISADYGEMWEMEGHLFFGHSGRWHVVLPEGGVYDTGVPRGQGEILEDTYPGDSWKELITGPG